MSDAATHQPGIAARLFREGYMFDFFQAVRLLETFFPGGNSPGETSDVANEQIRFRPHHGLGFPASDIRSIDRLPGPTDRARITAAFMGLYGVDSPLPFFFYDAIATEADNAGPLRDFLDIFNHRLYSLFYRSLTKYRLFGYYDRASTRRSLMTRALSLSGLGTINVPDETGIRPLHLAAFAGILSSQVRNGEGLQNLLVELLGGIAVTVQENIPRWVAIPGRGRLGRTTKTPLVLSETSTIGERVEDITGKFRLALGPLTFEQYVSLLPGGVRTQTVRRVVRLYARDGLDYDVQLNLKTAEVPLLRLGEKSLKLGLTTWLGRPAGETTSRVVDRGGNSHFLIPTGAL